MTLATADGSTTTNADSAHIRPSSRRAQSCKTTKLDLSTWFLGFDLIGEAKTGIMSLALHRDLDCLEAPD
jgi:hypothetical protein